MSKALRAVADVNVLVSAARSPNGLCGVLLEDAAAGRWIPVVSVLLIQELEEVLARPKFRNVLGQHGILTTSTWWRPLARQTSTRSSPVIATSQTSRRPSRRSKPRAVLAAPGWAIAGSQSPG